MHDAELAWNDACEEVKGTSVRFGERGRDMLMNRVKQVKVLPVYLRYDGWQGRGVPRHDRRWESPGVNAIWTRGDGLWYHTPKM